MTRRVFISDIHITAGLSFRSAHPYDPLGAAERDRLLDFLRWLNRECEFPNHGSTEPVNEIILLGDIFDNWIFPHDEKPPRMSEILASDYVRPVIDSLHELSQKSRILFFPGNHDITLGAETLHAVLPGFIHGGPGYLSPDFNAGRLRAGHGSAYTLFCCADPNRPDHLPMAYFISRLAASAVRDTGNDMPNLTAMMHELVDVCGPEKLPESVLDAACEKLGANQSTQVQMPDDVWGGTVVTIGEVRKTYARLLEEYQESNGKIRALLAISAELGVMGPVANSLFLHHGTTAVIFGHSHAARIRYGYRLGLGRTAYLNTGSWCNGAATWVEVQRRTNAKTSLLSLYKWTEGTAGQPGGPSLVDEPVIVD